MAYLMTDMAAGGQAALQLQQTMAAAPNVQQVEANKMQAQGLAIQQEQANLEKTKLANLVSESGFKTDEESKLKLRGYMQTPEAQQALKEQDYSTIFKNSGAILMQNNKVEEGIKWITAGKNLDSKKIADRQTAIAADMAEAETAIAVLDSLPKEKHALAIENLPENSKKALINLIGEASWNKFTPEEKIAATHEILTKSRSGKAKELKEVELEKARINAETRERIAEMNNATRLQIKSMGNDHLGSDRSMRDWNLYTKAQEAIERTGKKTLEKLDEAVDKADAAMTASIPWYSSNPSKEATAAYTKAIEARDNFKRDQIKKEINLATSAPDFAGKNIILENLQQQLALYPKEVTPIKLEEDKPEAKPAPAPTAKPVPSNKDSGTKTAPIAMPKSAAEAVDGKYYTTKAGVRKWDAKTQTFVE
ncbi:hypothetical protein UFOVP252_59 [uncultured Caudovirales phage]|uniref:Uncharacterized protein n=1 Tax=uncultured Caudovirales phage TaxID=2100421 RepID=A0A6J5LJ42_9CAUD|nr:hypothetical protein UFOVP252_59 [uncultured Caudovirales phage]